MEYSLYSTFRIAVPIWARHQTMDHLYRTEHLMCWKCTQFSFESYFPSQSKYVSPALTLRRSSTSPSLPNQAPAIASVLNSKIGNVVPSTFTCLSIYININIHTYIHIRVWAYLPRSKRFSTLFPRSLMIPASVMHTSVTNLIKIILPLIVFFHLPDSSLIKVCCIGLALIQYQTGGVQMFMSSAMSTFDICTVLTHSGQDIDRF